ncbi:MAG: hypothetical protein R2755_35210 [Acidimicrobiales bacterium]
MGLPPAAATELWQSGQGDPGAARRGVGMLSAGAAGDPHGVERQPGRAAGRSTPPTWPGSCSRLPVAGALTVLADVRLPFLVLAWRWPPLVPIARALLVEATAADGPRTREELPGDAPARSPTGGWWRRCS